MGWKVRFSPVHNQDLEPNKGHEDEMTWPWDAKQGEEMDAEKWKQKMKDKCKAKV